MKFVIVVKGTQVEEYQMAGCCVKQIRCDLIGQTQILLSSQPQRFVCSDRWCMVDVEKYFPPKDLGNYQDGCITCLKSISTVCILPVKNRVIARCVYFFYCLLSSHIFQAFINLFDLCMPLC